MKRSLTLFAALALGVLAGAQVPSIGQIPVTDMVSPQTYMGLPGGLYGGYSNVRPPFWQTSVFNEASFIQPRDASGVPSKAGAIGFCSIGMSNTFQEWSVFTPLAQTSGLMDPYVTLVNGAQGGKDLNDWGTGNDPTVYPTLATRVAAAGLNNLQVQVVWIKHSLRQPAQYGPWTGAGTQYMKDMRRTLQKLRLMFPNLRVAYISTRVYAGWATVNLSPEPYAYEQPFFLRRLINLQASGDPTLNWNASAGTVKCPIICWGPYMWADGLTPRSDGLQWFQTDFLATDGTHPSPTGRNKVANLMLKFFATDSTCGWFQP